MKDASIPMKDKKIGDYLKEELPDISEQINRSLEIQAKLYEEGVRRPIGQLMVESGWLEEDVLERSLTRQREDILASNQLFKSYSRDSLVKVAQISRNITMPGGTVIFEQYDEGDALYIIISGRVRVYRISDEGIEVTLSILEKGESFGELALLTGEPRSASVSTQEETNLIVVPKDAFDQTIASSPELFKASVKILADWLSRGNIDLMRASSTERAYQRFVSEQIGSVMPGVIGRSKVIEKIQAQISERAENSEPVLITGEAGTEMWDIAGVIHLQSKRADRPFLRIDAKTVAIGKETHGRTVEHSFHLETAQFSALFGQKQGAIPSAPYSRLGLIQVADGGGLVIENIDKLEDRLQKTLADFIQHGRFQPIGYESYLHSSARIFATCTVDLKEMVQEGIFDSRLYSLLINQTITIPPLRRRKRDIGQLVEHYIDRYERQTGKRILGIDEDAYQSVMAYDWPGNTDELEWVIRRAVHLARSDHLTAEDIFINPPPVRGKITFNLLRLDRVRHLFKSGLFPWIPRIVSGLFLFAVVLLGFFGSQSPDRNISLVLTWGWWEPMVVVSAFFAARIWCGICPIGALNSLISRVTGLRKKVPSIIRKYGFYFSAAGIAVIFWAESASRMVVSPRATAILVLSVTVLAAIAGLIYQRRVWCRYLCPLGGLVGLLSGCSVVELRSNYSVCTNDCTGHDCYKGSDKLEGCPVFEAPFSLNSNQNCMLCGNCIKLCPSNSPILNLRLPGHELWSTRRFDRAVAIFGLTLIGTQLFRGMENAGYFHQLETALIPWWAVSLFIIVGVTSIAYLLARACGNWFFHSIQGRSSERLDRVVYGLIPLATSFEISHQIERTLSKAGLVIPVLGRQLGFVWDFLGVSAEPLSIKAIQFFIILIGTLGSAAVLKRIIKSQIGESIHFNMSRRLVPVLVLAATYFWLVLKG
jgi:transcriptional regulator with AAA-type ATPase domain